MRKILPGSMIDTGTRSDPDYWQGESTVEWFTYALGDIASVSVTVTVAVRTFSAGAAMGTVTVVERFFRPGSGLTARQAREAADAALRCHSGWTRTAGERARFDVGPVRSSSQWSLTFASHPDH